MNIKVVLEYDGALFKGWQQQTRPGVPFGEVPRTVEGELKRALRELGGQDYQVHAAGRTDAGAHAEGQVASFHWQGRVPVGRLAAALNAHLPPDVSVLSAEAVADAFHARYSARWRRYRYRYFRNSSWHSSTRHH